MMVTVVAVLIAAVAIFVVPSGQSLRSLSGAQIMRKSLAAASKAGTGHMEFSTADDGNGITGSIDFSPSGGIETANYGTDTITVVYVGGSLYMRADAGLLAQVLNMSGAEAAQYGGQWISLPLDTADLQQMSGQLQTSVLISDLLTLAGPITKTRVTKARNQGPGQVALEGRLANNSYNDGSGAGDVTTLTVSAKAPYYPLSLYYSDQQSAYTQITFSNWGERLDLKAPQNPIPAGQLGFGGSAVAPTGPDESTTPAPSITATSPQAGVAVTPVEAQTVATQLWEAWVQARATRDVTALETLDAQPELSADWGYICQYTCAGPQLTLSSIAVTVARQSKWPADFLATATFTADCEASASPCDNSFVAVQSAPGAPWKIATMTNWSGHSYATTAPVPAGQFSPAPTPPPSAHVTTLPREYAQYLQAIRRTGQPPAGTRLAPGPFTTDLIATNYYPPSEQQADGRTDTITYSTNPDDPIWRFAGTNGATAVCGAVHYSDAINATTIPLVQSPSDHPYGDLTTGTYSSITMTGIHLVCFEVYSNPSQPVAVIGTWGDAVTATGTAIQAQANPN
jgi:hypothetical protein